MLLKIAASLLFLITYTTSVYATSSQENAYNQAASSVAFVNANYHPSPAEVIFDTGTQECASNPSGTDRYACYTYTPNSCPGTQYWKQSTGLCTADPVCISPYVLQNHVCYMPKECAYPETDNGSGVCANNTCPGNQTRNPLTKACQTPPTCGSTETYDITSNTCKLYPLKCPVNSHPSTANDACLADAPKACPLGQHDDGTYTCIADSISACTSSQQYGKINGQSVCINKTNTEQAKNDADVARTNATIAKATADAAAATLAADPTNTAKQAANAAAQAAYNAAKSASDQAQNDQNSSDLSGIDQDLKAIHEALKGGDAPAAPSGSLVDDMGTGAETNLSKIGTGFLSSPYSLPGANPNCISIPFHYRTMNYNFTPCDKLAPFREMFGYLLYMLTAYGILGILRKPAA